MKQLSVRLPHLALPENSVMIGLDVGGTKIAGAATNLQGDVVRTIRQPTDKTSPESLIDQLASIVEVLMKELPSKDLVAVGVGLPGQVDIGKGTTYSPTNLGWPTVVSIRRPLEKIVGSPIYLDNDLNTAVLGEWIQGTGVGSENFCYITIGTGLAVGLIINGQLYRGAHSVAGELGHMVVDPHEDYCPCGLKGCLEFLVAGPGIARRFQNLVQARTGQKLLISGAEEVFERARCGDPLACEIVEETARFLAIGLNSLVVLLDPEVIAIGGGVSDAGDVFFDALRRHLDQWMSSIVDKRVKIVPATLGSDTGVVGALITAALGHGRQDPDRVSRATRLL